MENKNNSTGEVKAPLQYSSNKYILAFKKFIHTKIGARIGFMLGLRGFNRMQAVHSKFQRFHDFSSKPLKTGEFIQKIKIATGEMKLAVFTKSTRFEFAYNSRVNKGGDLAASLLAATSFNSISSPLTPKYIALSTSTLTPDKTDTTLTGETAASGLARAAGTIGGYTGPATLDGACSYTVSKTFTNTSAGAVTVVSAALFDAASTGNLFVEANLSSSAVMAINDTLAITWTINL